jgi:hypothetical protein
MADGERPTERSRRRRRAEPELPSVLPIQDGLDGAAGARFNGETALQQFDEYRDISKKITSCAGLV